MLVAPVYVDGRLCKVWLRVRGLEQGRLGLAFLWEEVDGNSDDSLSAGIECNFHACGVRVMIGLLCTPVV